MKRREEHISHAPLFKSVGFGISDVLLFGRRRWRRHVNINFLGPAAEETSAKHKERDYNDNHEDYQDSHHSRAAATTIIITHKPDPPSAFVQYPSAKQSRKLFYL
jgi:hypothetical protein